MAAGFPGARSELPSYTYEEERDASFLDELIRVADDKRTEVLGPNYFSWAKEFFLFRPSFWQPQLEYQIKLRMSDLQTLVMQEASDLTDSEPVFFVSRGGKRAKDREKAFSANWRANYFQMEIFKAMMWAMTCHTGFIEVIANPARKFGNTGIVSIRARNSENTYPDPYATDWREWEYVIVRVPMAPDEIVRSFPHAAGRLPGILIENQRNMYLSARTGNLVGSGPEALELPPGAMQSVPIGRPPGSTDFLAVDYVFIKDDARENVIKEIVGAQAAGAVLPPPRTLMKYPTGRLVIRTGKLKLWDGPNSYSTFPIVPVFSMPPLYGVWGTPPIQYLIQMQHLAESMYSQRAENMIRMNYGYRVYQDGAILNPENFDKLGGLIRVKTASDVAQAFRYVPPPAMSADQGQFGDQLMGHMRELFGYTPERSGKAGSGNISPGLFDAAVSNAQSITRMRARLLSEAVEYTGRLVYNTMVQYQDDAVFTEAFNGDLRTAPWTGIPLDQFENWDIQLDPSSLRPMASSTLRQLVPVLANLGMITPEYALKWLNVPHAEDIAAQLAQQKQEAAIMAAVQGGGKKGGKK